MKIVITVAGKDRIGIVADIAAVCKQLGVNIVDITQKVFDDMFTMVMLTKTTSDSVPFDEIVSKLEACGEKAGLKIHIMHEDIFNSMHRI